MEKEDVVKCAICGAELSGIEVMRHMGAEKVYLICEVCYENKILNPHL